MSHVQTDYDDARADDGWQSVTIIEDTCAVPARKERRTRIPTSADGHHRYYFVLLGCLAHMLAGHEACATADGDHEFMHGNVPEAAIHPKSSDAPIPWSYAVERTFACESGGVGWNNNTKCDVHDTRILRRACETDITPRQLCEHGKVSDRLLDFYSSSCTVKEYKANIDYDWYRKEYEDVCKYDSVLGKQCDPTVSETWLCDGDVVDDEKLSRDWSFGEPCTLTIYRANAYLACTRDELKEICAHETRRLWDDCHNDCSISGCKYDKFWTVFTGSSRYVNGDDQDLHYHGHNFIDNIVEYQNCASPGYKSYGTWPHWVRVWFTNGTSVAISEGTTMVYESGCPKPAVHVKGYMSGVFTTSNTVTVTKTNTCSYGTSEYGRTHFYGDGECFIDIYLQAIYMYDSGGGVPHSAWETGTC